MSDTPKSEFLPCFLLVNMKQNAPSKIVDIRFLREEISRLLIRRGGLSKWTIKYIIEDLIKVGAIERKNKTGLYILRDLPNERRITNLINLGI